MEDHMPPAFTLAAPRASWAPRFLAGVLVAASLAGVAGASNTWIVDAAGGPGAHFTNIPPAIAAAVDGDLILVRPGAYSGFTLDKGVTLLAQGVASAAGATRIENVAAGARSAVVGIDLDDLEVSACDGFLLLRNLSLATLKVTASRDVRIHSVVTSESCDLGTSRVEVVRCELRGADGATGWDNGEPGENGLVCRISGRYHLALTTAEGGDGGDGFGYPPFLGGYGGAGGHGAYAEPHYAPPPEPLELILTGEADYYQGGDGGYGYDCPYDGSPGYGVLLGSSYAGSSQGFGSGLDLHGGMTPCASGPIPGLGVSFPSTFTPLQPDHPTLELIGGSAPGQTVTFRIRGPAGASTRLFLGRSPRLEPVPGVLVESLTDVLRSISLGSMPPSGSLDFPVFLPFALPQGMLVLAQASTTLPGGATSLTNSTPFVIH